MKITYYKQGENYIAVTTLFPAGFKGVLYVGKGPQPGAGIESIFETAYELNQIKKLEQVERDDVPDEWVSALGYEQPTPTPLPVPPAPPPVPVIITQPVQIVPQTTELRIDWFPWDVFGRYEGKSLSPEQQSLGNWLELGIFVAAIIGLLIFS